VQRVHAASQVHVTLPLLVVTMRIRDGLFARRDAATDEWHGGTGGAPTPLVQMAVPAPTTLEQAPLVLGGP
jgi:hypothetical protein